ncbi:hypothetical protein P170DRAFT_376246 [Aspergillus steynii IBT 23096]|uniref:Altered inheritance of mitochondria protein 9, mitochondrial n=1 Tax=Aspergillus steynii IBT 23096 TaxID=1392250 RepID=A0A2I2GKK4_9EURO|nr:uncharacterized protein P170DRAFT_376246 [Aspergillus steynii IBT 23096]PLB53413.1 hypothetical protein P170DRAFT_376246 [Aspergillus steynii IBT 23096]
MRLNLRIRSRASPRPFHVFSGGNSSLSLPRSINTGGTPWTKTKRDLHPNTPQSFKPKFNPHAYTSGHWLLNNHEQHSLRHIEFDFSALCLKIQALCPENGPIVSCEKLEGGNNRVFVFALDDGRRVVARLPFRTAGRTDVLVRSEVAMGEFLQSKTQTPVPKIMDWSDDVANPIGAEYIIMECVSGVQLHQAWRDMSGVQQLKCIRSIYKVLKPVVELSFPAYGSIYFTGDVEASVARDLDDRFAIGPHCSARYYWEAGVMSSDRGGSGRGNRGPWVDFNAFCDGLVDAGLSRLPSPDLPVRKRPSFYGSVQDHIELLSHARRVLHAMAADPRIKQCVAPTLFHPDLHKRNIFVSREDPTVITGIIDWQAASIEPAFWYADEVPDFATTRDEHLCHQAFDAITQLQLPKIGQPRSMNANLFRPFRYTHNTWANGAVALRHDLIQTAQYWNAMGFVGTCPYATPTAEELATHQEEYEYFKTVFQLERMLMEGLNVPSDGWVPPEAWELTQQVHRELFDEFVRAVLDDPDDHINSEEEARIVWPYDI